ncbi:MAG: rok family [Prolixibacteraceae bacterium]|nr:MAG: rok family [Prolixibacteraceae bacterium]
MILAKGKNRNDLSGNELKKFRQKKKILHLLYQYHTLSGTAISSKIGVSFPTALTLLNELCEFKFVETFGTGVSSGGRKPNMYRLSNESIYVIACELGRYKAKMTIYNSHNNQVTSILTFATNIDDNELVEKIYVNAQRLIQEFKIDENRVYGIGLNMPGLIDENRGINHTIKNEEYRNVKERLETRFGKMVYVNNDARMQAYGEYIFGSAKGHLNAIVVNWNWGIGMGLIFNGNLYNGSTGFAGELSHTKFVDEGDLCICGKRGCLETVASSNFLIKNAAIGINENVVSQLTLSFKNRQQDLQPEDVINAAKSGDEFAISLLNKIGMALGKGLSFTIQLLNPEIIVLGGVISQANRFVLTPIQQSLNKYCLDKISSNVKIVISENWEQAGLLGVSAMLFQHLFGDIHSELKYENF